MRYSFGLHLKVCVGASVQCRLAKRLQVVVICAKRGYRCKNHGMRILLVDDARQERNVAWTVFIGGRISSI